MSQVMSARTSSGMSHSSIPKLPQIDHPLSKMTGSGKISVRGVSRASSRPLPQEEPDFPTSRHSYRSSGAAHRLTQSMNEAPLKCLDEIPEDIKVVQGDPNKTQLPIFGNRADCPSRDKPVSRASSKVSQLTSDRLEIDELEIGLREKMKSGYYEMRKRFVDNDPEQKGNVTRDAMLRILVSVLNRPVTVSQLGKLLIRLGMRSDKTVISFTEFHSAFRDVASASKYPKWMDPVQRHHQEKIYMSSDEVHANLKERMKQRFVDLADFFPQFIDGGAGRIMKAELRNTLAKLQFWMEEEEFEKLWKRYDPHDNGVINGIHLLRELGIYMRDTPKKKWREDTPSESTNSDVKPKRKLEIDRERSLMIENWLKEKLREGFYRMRASFEEADPARTGKVDFDTFLRVLQEHDLKLEKAHLAEFLARCAVTPFKTGVPYREFLHRFQDRSEAGMTHKILNEGIETNNIDVTKQHLFELETQLMNMFQRDFLNLLSSFQKIDRFGTGLISKEEFRAAMESKFRLDLTDEQFNHFMDNVPLDKTGHVEYGEFMKQFDTRGLAPSLFEPKESVEEVADNNEKEINTNGCDQEGVPPNFTKQNNRRTGRETHQAIKQLFETRFQDLEREFYELDIYNSGRLTQEQMYSLLKRLNVEPEITRGEIRDIWKKFILNDNLSLDFKEFVRHFIYNKDDCCFPNAKVVPPRKGDDDLRMRSRKLNCAADMLHDNLRSKIDYMWDQLRLEFVEMDPYGTGFVSKEEFQEVLRELCVHLSDYEVETIARKFTFGNDERVSYVEFLKPFAMKKQVWRHGNNMLALLQQAPGHDDAEEQRKLGSDIADKIKPKLLHCDSKILRRGFRKLDAANTGCVNQGEFQSVLKLADIALTEEEMFELLSKYDTNLTGKIPYSKFLDECCAASKVPKGMSRNPSRKETARSSIAA